MAGTNAIERSLTKTWLRLMLSLAVFAAIWLLGGALKAQRTAPARARVTADQVFKNVQVMKGTPVDDFMGRWASCAPLWVSTAPIATSGRARRK